MTKIVTNIVTKALEKGKATVNGRPSYAFGEKGELQEKYSATLEGKTFRFYHWGTQTLEIDVKARKVMYYYGVGNSDRDSMNHVLYLLGVSGKFRYRPVNGGFTYEK